MTTWEAAAVTHRGNVRTINEDAVAIDGQILSGAQPASTLFSLSSPPHVVMVADGLGGHSHGATASQAALRYLTARLEQLATPRQCADAILAANDHLYDLMRQSPAMTGMGTTLAGAALTSAALLTVNVGDSRVYLHRPQTLFQVSEDDISDIGIGASHARSSHVITQALGGASVRTSISPHLQTGPPLAASETLLVCSDGLTDMVPDAIICAALDRGVALTATADALLNAALRAGGRDNVSVILVRATQAPP